MGAVKLVRGNDKLSRVFTERSHRVAAAWRRMRVSQLPPGKAPGNLLDPLVESFIVQIGRKLANGDVSPWGATRGVLRIAPERGLKALLDEFASLRRCLLDAAAALGGSERDCDRIEHALAEAKASAAAVYRQRTGEGDENPKVPFGGVVVEVFGTVARPRGAQKPAGPVPVH